jgi:hypothetical protein
MFSKYLESILNIPIDENIALKEYHESKQMLKEVFKNQLIHEKEIIIENRKETYQNLYKVLSKNKSLLLKLFDLFPQYYYIFVKTDTYYSNKIYFEITIKDKTFPEGTKPFKVLNYLSKLTNIDIEQFRIEISKALQYKRLKTTLCLSIHPLDFLTLSDNNLNWSSCLSILNNGCYHQGIIEMLNSPYIFIAYCKSKEKYINSKGLIWNDKILRSLILYNKDFVLPIKEYPSRNDAFIAEAVNFFLELAGLQGKQEIYSPYDGKIITETGRIPKIFSTTIMYNDIVEDDYDRLIWLTRPKEEWDSQTVVNYSGVCTCMSCGQEFDTYGGEADHLVCPECGGFIPCAQCEADCSEDEEIYNENGDRICHNCYNYNNEECPICKEVVGGMNMTCLGIEIETELNWIRGCSNCLQPDVGSAWIPGIVRKPNLQKYYSKEKIRMFKNYIIQRGDTL